MVLSGRFLTNVGSVNSYSYAEVGEFTSGDTVSVYFQLIDITMDKSNDGFVPPGRRYIPITGSILQCTVESLDEDKVIVRYATMAYSADDRSIWRLDFLPSDAIRGTANLRLKLIENGVVRSGIIKNGLRIHSLTCL